MTPGPRRTPLRRRIWRIRWAGGPRLVRHARWAVAVSLLLTTAWFVWPFWRLSARFGELEPRVPSRLYGAPMELAVGRAVDRRALVGELEFQGYRPGEARRIGTYALARDAVAVHLRAGPTPAGWRQPGRLEVALDGRWVEALSWRGQPVPAVTLTPPLLASYHGPQLQARWPVAVDELPDVVVDAVLAAEDDSFFHHPGLSLSGIARAVWVNVRGGEVRQGGSTLTQQLVKNLYLTHERTLLRKAREAVLAVLLEARYRKEEILEAYLNEIYWGRSGVVHLVGVGAAARAYLGKDPREVDLAEAALLAGMIRAPGLYAPETDAARARARRDWVLGRMAALGSVSAEAAAAARESPLPASRPPLVARRAPYFADAAAREAAERFAVPELADAGYALLSTLSRSDQEAAEDAVEWGLEALEQGWEKGRRAAGPLQAAVVSIEPGTGAVLAWVGGRSYALSQFDRVSQSRRQAGSAFKPVVYAAALEEGRVAPSSRLLDRPLTVRMAGRTWTPQNDDDRFRGEVSVRTALERSLNVPTARLAIEVGLGRVVQVARGLGIEAPLEPYPSLALGAFEVSPLELATAYATLAAGGVRPPVHGLLAVLGPDGRPVPARGELEAERALTAEAAYLLTSVLQGVVERGTGRGLARMGVGDRLAGKTGTTNDRRDSWFSGYSPDRATLVWVGYDDNSPTRLSGARAALPIFGRFVAAVRPAGGFPSFPQPEGVVTAAVDPATGELATDDCPQVITEVFLAGRVPEAVCRLHGGGWGRDDGRVHPVRRWLRRVFGRDDDGGG